MSIYGRVLKIELFGESHGPEIGVRIDGLPAGFRPDMGRLRAFLDRRAPGRSEWSSRRKEADEPVFTEGLENGALTGGRVTAVIRNTDARSSDYEKTRRTPRPGHADLGEYLKYGKISPGGGRFSGRMTAPLCVAGGLCLQLLEKEGVKIAARICRVGDVADDTPFGGQSLCEDFPASDGGAAERMKARIAEAAAEGDSVGGEIECVVTGLPAGLGDAFTDGMESRIAELVFGIPAVKGVEFGAGFAAARMKGSENNDPIAVKDGRLVTLTNNAGGILGGITDGMPLVFRAAFKPTPSIGKVQQSVYLEEMSQSTLEIKGRHDPCIVPRAVPVIEAAAAAAILDTLLESRAGAAEGRNAGLKDGAESKPAGPKESSGSDPAAPKRGGGDRPVDLKESRARLDVIDRQLTALFEERMRISADVAAYKAANGLPTFDPAREAEKLDRAAAALPEELAPYGREFFAAVMDIGKEYQNALRKKNEG